MGFEHGRDGNHKAEKAQAEKPDWIGSCQFDFVFNGDESTHIKAIQNVSGGLIAMTTRLELEHTNNTNFSVHGKDYVYKDADDKTQSGIFQYSENDVDDRQMKPIVKGDPDFELVSRALKDVQSEFIDLPPCSSKSTRSR